jgi:hypothetical protein
LNETLPTTRRFGSLIVSRRSVVDILDAGLAFYRREAPTLLVIVGAVFVPLYAVKSVVYSLGWIEFVRIFNAFEFLETASYTPANLALTLIEGITHTLSVGAVTYYVFLRATSDTVRFLTLASGVAPQALPLVWITFLCTVLTAAGFALCILPGLAAYVLFVFATPIVMTERYFTFGDVFRRSKELLSGMWWRTAGFLLVTWLLLFILGLSLTYLLAGVLQLLIEQVAWLSGLLPDVNLLTLLGGVVVSMLLLPLEAVFTTLLYFDVRSRKEGLDLLILSEQLP